MSIKYSAMPNTHNRGLLYSALQRFNNALENLDLFRKEKDLIDNIGYLDNFFSNYRSTTFVLQKSLSGTEFKVIYETLRDKYFNNDLGKWFVETRNEIEKQNPFDLNKCLYVTVYHPQRATILVTKSFSVENDVPYSDIIDKFLAFIKALQPIEVHFSIEFVFSKTGESRDLYEDLIGGITAMVGFLRELYSAIGDITPLCENLISKIEAATFYKVPKEYLFIDDCVYYPTKDTFEIADRQALLLKGEPISISQMFKSIKYPGIISDSKDFLKAIVWHHVFLYIKQNNSIMPTFFIVDNNNKCVADSFESTIRTTVYRKINDLAKLVLQGNIKHITLVHEGYVYKDFSHHNEAYIDRVKYKSGEVLMFDQIGKYNKYRTYVLDVTRVNDAKYIKERLKERPEDNSQIETSFFYPLYIAFKTIREAAQ